jgi:hypothetical protein
MAGALSPAHGGLAGGSGKQGRHRHVRAAAALVPPGAGERRQASDRAVRDRGTEVALRTNPEPQQRGLRRGELAPDARDRLGRHAAQLCAAVDGVLLQPLEQVVVAGAVLPAPLVVVDPRVHDRAHHPQGERGIGAR